MRRVVSILLLAIPLYVFGQDPEVAALRKQLEEQAAAIAELRAALDSVRSELKAAAPKGGAAPASAATSVSTAAPSITPPVAASSSQPLTARNDSGEFGPTVRATVPAPFNPWPGLTSFHPGPLAVRIGSGVTINPY